MDVETIIAILTAGLAVVTSVVSFIYSFIQGRRDRTRQVILANRIKYLDEIRDGFTKFIGLAHAEAIKSAKNNSEVLKNFSNNLFTGYGKIRTYIKPFYDIDNQLIIALDDLYNCILLNLNGENGDEDSLSRLRENFVRQYLIYDWAYWKYIQRQKEGNFMNSDDAFDKVYKDFFEEVKDKSF